MLTAPQAFPTPLCAPALATLEQVEGKGFTRLVVRDVHVVEELETQTHFSVLAVRTMLDPEVAAMLPLSVYTFLASGPMFHDHSAVEGKVRSGKVGSRNARGRVSLPLA